MNESFEEGMAGAVRRLTAFCVMLGIAFAVTLFLAGWAVIQARDDAAGIRSDQAALEASVHSPNHVKDVLVWCDAINATRSYDRAFVHRVTRGKVAYTLPLLPCESIADRTRKTVKP